MFNYQFSKTEDWIIEPLIENHKLIIENYISPLCAHIINIKSFWLQGLQLINRYIM